MRAGGYIRRRCLWNRLFPFVDHGSSQSKTSACCRHDTIRKVTVAAQNPVLSHLQRPNDPDHHQEKIAPDWPDLANSSMSHP